MRATCSRSTPGAGFPAAAPANPIDSFQASKFKLVVNLKTAQADEVIE
jgi:hypothetical protein